MDLNNSDVHKSYKEKEVFKTKLKSDSSDDKYSVEDSNYGRVVISDSGKGRIRKEYIPMGVAGAIIFAITQGAL